MTRQQPKYAIEDFIKDCQDQKNIALEHGVLASATRDFMLKTKSELLTYITNGKMEELEFINSIPYRNSREIPLPICDAYTFTSGYTSGYISLFISQ